MSKDNFMKYKEYENSKSSASNSDFINGFAITLYIFGIAALIFLLVTGNWVFALFLFLVVTILFGD